MLEGRAKLLPLKKKKSSPVVFSLYSPIFISFRKLGLETRTVDRYHFNDDAVRWADLIVSMGGDGTFLLAASKVLDQTPVIGVNTDPEGSEGHLCLPNRYTFLFDNAMKRILSGDFR